MQPREVLKKYWNHDRFRPLQEDIVKTVLDGFDLLALLPTGGGKSVCFQVPGIILEGVCLVISPLIALMKDQVENLKKKGIRADMISSSMSYRETDLLLDHAVFGHLKFLYVSPERLKNELFIERLKKMKVGLIAVDEAHCISQWGYDFRPAYLEIHTIREILPETPVIALTATATPEVADDITEKLQLKNRNIIRKSFRRENISYRADLSENKYVRLSTIMAAQKGSSIVYVRSRKNTGLISEYLRAHGISAAAYHAGMSPADREQKQNDWINNRFQVMVSTNAFGMGIDKPDVRMVIHFDLPPDPESYYQESGRAGRDENPASAVLLVDEKDIAEAERRLDQKYPPLDVIRRVNQAIGNHFELATGSGEGKTFHLDMPLLAKNFNLRQTDLHYSLLILEKQGLISLSDSAGLHSRVHFIVNKEKLYNFQVLNDKLDPFIKLLLRSYGGLFDSFVRIDEAELAKRSGTNPGKVISQLKFLQKSGLLVYSEKTSLPGITFLLPRQDSASLVISKEVYSDMKVREQKRLQAMIGYVKMEKGCRANLLLQYFGEKTETPCGTCDLCLQKKPDHLSALIRNKIQENKITLSDLVFELADWNEQDVLQTVRKLLDEKIIQQHEEHLIIRS